MQSLPITIALVGVSAFAVDASAVGTNTARATVSPNFAGGTGPVDQIVNSAGPADATGSATGGFSSSGDATAHTNYKVITTAAHALGSLNATGSGQVRDVLHITAPGVPINTIGTLTYSMSIMGSMTAPSGSSGSTWTLRSDINGGAYDLTRSGGFSAPSFPNHGYHGDPFGTCTVTTTFQFGQALPLDIEVAGTAQAAYASGDPSASATCILSPGFAWGGISDININGTPVPGVSVTSDSGTNWAIGAGACNPDFNGDGDVGTDQDIEAFFACLAGTCCPTCGSADFNGDGDVGTDADIESFFRVLAGGAC